MAEISDAEGRLDSARMQALDELSVADMCVTGSAVDFRQLQTHVGPVGMRATQFGRP